jgi:hypothetical protein
MPFERVCSISVAGILISIIHYAVRALEGQIRRDFSWRWQYGVSARLEVSLLDGG